MARAVSDVWLGFLMLLATGAVSFLLGITVGALIVALL